MTGSSLEALFARYGVCTFDADELVGWDQGLGGDDFLKFDFSERVFVGSMAGVRMAVRPDVRWFIHRSVTTALVVPAAASSSRSLCLPTCSRVVWGSRNMRVSV